MSNLLYTIACVLIVIWCVSFIGFHIASGLLHILLVIALISIILGVIRRGYI